MSSPPESTETLLDAPIGRPPGAHAGLHGRLSIRTMSIIIALSLAAVGTAIYLSPGTSKPTGQALGLPAPSPSRTPDGSAAIVSLQPAPSSATTSATPRPTGTGSTAPGGHVSYVPVYNTYRIPGATTRRTIVYIASSHSGTAARPGGTVTVSATPKRLWCTDFKWQQDAQAAYLANLSDPWGLDGAPGPHNGDGLACTQLPVDPSRAASIPVDGYGAPAPAGKQQLVEPAGRYFGVAEDGLPGDTALFAKLATQTGKAPSQLSWFSTWDSGYDAAKVRASWAQGALPMITWMTVAQSSSAPTAGSYTLARIVNGDFDAYLLRYAGAVIKTGLPVAIRFDHEMNGNWFPWSAGMPANAGGTGQPNLYVQAWRHVWNVFDSVGANDDVIWVWAPSRVDSIVPHSTKPGLKYETGLAEDYPGDQYVDWVGMSAYQYKPSDGWRFETTFRNTLTALHQLCAKRIFVAETGATEAVGSVDYATEKAKWINETLSGLAAEPDVVGFSWFNNTVNDVHTVDGQLIQTDWQFSSSPAALQAFSAGVASPVFTAGVMPDTLGGSK